MPFAAPPLKHRVTRLRSLASFVLVAMAQYLSPAAAADPASKIDPPAWSLRHSQQELQAYGTRAQAQESTRQASQRFSQARLRRLTRAHRPDGS